MSEEKETEEPHIPEPKKVKDKIEHKKPSAPARVTERKEMEKSETSRKTHKVTREARPTRPLTKLEAANTALLRLYDTTVGMLQEGINKGSTNAPLGLISFMAYIDLLHGGAYAAPINELPFFQADKDKSPYWAGTLQNTDAATGLGGWIASLFGGLNAGPLVQETLEDANVPHVFPKLLSDQMYAILKTIFAWFTTTDLLKNAGTGVTTFVEAGVKAVQGVAQASETTARAIKTVTPSAEEMKALLPLLSLMGG